MFGLVKLGVGMVALLAVAWFGITVKLGERTLFQHLRAISQTKESQELVDGTKQVAAPVVDDVRRRISGKTDPEATPDGGAGAPQERLSSSEQRQLRELLKKMDPHTTEARPRSQ